jgi:hypothetical protein
MLGSTGEIVTAEAAERRKTVAVSVTIIMFVLVVK